MLRPSSYEPASPLDQEVFAAVVPAEHYLRRVLAVVDFDRLREELASCYHATYGRPALEPLLLLKLEFLEFQYNLSDRGVIDRARCDLAFRLFLGLGLRSPLPHHTLLTVFRERLGPERHQRLFDAVVAQARERGLVKDRLRLKDATHLVANIAIPSAVRLVAQMRQRVLKAVRPFEPVRVAEEEAHAERLRAATADLSDTERLAQRVAHLRSIVAWVEERHVGDDAANAATPTGQEVGQGQAVAQALRLAHKVLADRENPRAPDKLLSVEDPDARWGRHGVLYAGYKFDVAVDADSGLITALNVLPATGDEATDAPMLIRQEEQAHGNYVAALSLDGVGFNGPVLRECTDPQGLNLEVFVPVKQEREDVFPPQRFALSSTGDQVTCPAGQTTHNRTRISEPDGWQFRFTRSVCQACPLLRQCVTKLPKKRGRVVFKSDYEAEHQAARAKAQTPEYQAVRRQHWRIERKLAEAVRRHGSRRARYRGSPRTLIQGLLTGLVINAKRLVRLMGASRVRAELAASG